VSYLNQRLHRAEVQDLQSVIAALKDELNELRTALLCLLKQAAPVVASLSTEDIVQELKKDVEKLQSTISKQQVSTSYASAVRNCHLSLHHDK